MRRRNELRQFGLCIGATQAMTARAHPNTQKTGDVLSLQDYSIDPEDLHIFDFDGVIISRDYYDIYDLPPTDDEKQLISSTAAHFGIRCSDMDQRYQRHLTFEAAAWKLRLPFKPGPGFSHAIQASQQSRFFILTARCSWHAVARLRDFLQQSQLFPLELFTVGLVPKYLQISLICRESPARRAFFIDDLAANIEAVKKNIDVNHLQFVHATGEPKADEETLREYCYSVLSDAIKYD